MHFECTSHVLQVYITSSHVLHLVLLHGRPDVRGVDAAVVEVREVADVAEHVPVYAQGARGENVRYM